MIRPACFQSYAFQLHRNVVGFVACTFTRIPVGIATRKVSGFRKNRAKGPVGSFSGATVARTEMPRDSASASQLRPLDGELVCHVVLGIRVQVAGRNFFDQLVGGLDPSASAEQSLPV